MTPRGHFGVVRHAESGTHKGQYNTAWGHTSPPRDLPLRADVLESMMKQQLASEDGFNGCDCCTYPGCPRYNELVLDPGTWIKRLPSTIEAIIFTADGQGRHKDVSGLEAHARRVHSHFRKAFSTSKHA